MWLITSVGFFSVVQKPGDQENGTLTVRSRVRSDLAALKKHYLPGLGAIHESFDTDYRFRAVAPRTEVSAAMARMVDAIDYGNFKSEVAKQQGHKRAGLYHQVWDVLYQLQNSPDFVETESIADSYGGVVVSGGHKVLLREPANHHGGYAWTFAKTVAKAGESPRDAAIRSVREKTGYDAEIRISVPGVFKGSSSSTCYYVMDAKHPPARAGWQTSGLRWVDFGEARDLIRQSPNAEGRERDLAILEAAEKAAGAIAYKEHPNVQPEDWQDLKPMPERHTVLYPKLWFNPDEMKNIRRGFLPTVMEQKWFLYFTGDRLRMHRSWTGVLIFDVGFAFDAKGGAHVTDVIVNRESREYSNIDDGQDLVLLEEIIRYDLLQPIEEPEVDGFVKAMELAMQPKYLGSPEVVTGLVKEIFDVTIRAMDEEDTEDDFIEVVAKVTSAFTNENSGYTRMPSWHSTEQMGKCIKKYLLGGGEEGQYLPEIISNGMSAVIAKLQEMLGGYLQDPVANWEEHGLVQLNALHQFVVTVLLGTNLTLSGEKTLGDFHWVPIATGAEVKKVIVEVCSEGGSLTLAGIEFSEGWKFRVETNEAALEDGDMTDSPERPWVRTWRSALKQMDAYPWTQLHAVKVHPEFCDRVFNALQTRKKKGIPIDWNQWGNALNILIDDE